MDVTIDWSFVFCSLFSAISLWIIYNVNFDVTLFCFN
jgi:hypothetical protein